MQSEIYRLSCAATSVTSFSQDSKLELIPCLCISACGILDNEYVLSSFGITVLTPLTRHTFLFTNLSQ